MTREEIQDLYPNDELLFADGFDDCIIGVAHGLRLGNPVVAYSMEKVLQSLLTDMDYDEAREFISFNITGAYMGENTPIYIDLLEDL